MKTNLILNNSGEVYFYGDQLALDPPINTLLVHFENDLTDSSINNLSPATNYGPVYNYGLMNSFSNSIKKFGNYSAKWVLSSGTPPINVFLVRWNSAIACNFKTNDFTVDFWMYQTSSSSGGLELYGNSSILKWNNIGVYIKGTNKIASHSFTLNSWVHYAVTRELGIVRAFKNGTLLSTGITYANDIDTSSGGRTQLSYLLPDPFFYVDELRIINGTAIWTSNFTPPTQAYS